ncbi:MAG: FMN-dependent NADH-azoreductase [Cyclobacteriaceae bacterium]|nr:FMN-dependent NADH-azoreductase [Cyclobacteriaceae bacterium]
MKKLLHIIGSPRKEASESEKIAAAFIEQYKKSNKDAQIDVLNLWTEKMPLFDGNKAAAKMTFFGTGTLEGDIKSAWDEVVSVTNRFTSADEYLITVPMWNGGISWTLKNYIDTITQPGLTFGFGAEGYFPLLKNKKACVIYTSGVYSPALPKPFGLDFQAAYMDWWLEFIGVAEIHAIKLLSNVLTKDIAKDRHDANKQAIEIAKSHFA